MERRIETSNILAIESAVGGGSVALVTSNGEAFVKQHGNDSSRAEKILSVITGLLEDARLKVGDLDLIAVSAGPGSYSGIRIGLSTALGLARALTLPCVQVSVLEAMAISSELTTPIIAAVPIGKDDAAWQAFDLASDGVIEVAREPELMSVAAFARGLELFADSTVLVHGNLIGSVAPLIPDTRILVDAGKGLAERVARFAVVVRDGTGRASGPIYLRNQASAGRNNSF